MNPKNPDQPDPDPPASPTDEDLLIDHAMGRLSDDQAADLRSRLDADPVLARKHRDVANALSALNALPEHDAPADLTERTMQRVRQERQLDALIQREQSQKRRFRPTFRLAEIAAAIILLLAVGALLLPSLNQSRQINQAGLCQATAGQIGTGLLAYANANDGYLPHASFTPARWMADGQADQPVVSNSAGLFRLIEAEYLGPNTFQCPATDNQTFVARSGMVDFPQPDNISYSYQHSVGPVGLRLSNPRITEPAEVVVLGDANPVFEKGRFHRDRLDAPGSANHDYTGQSVLAMDGSVRWAKDAQAGPRGNNIFLIDGVYDYQGHEMVPDPVETFLLPAYTPRSGEN